MATKSISQLDSAVSLALGDLFEIAEPDAQSQTGYASKKISLSQEAAFIQENVESQNLNTTSKTLVGAINEVDSEGVKWSENNVLGAKNLLKYPYYYSSQEINGIKWTVNSDGTVTATGTATANSSFYLHLRNEGEVNDFVLPNGTYIISDGLATHSLNIEIQMGITKNGAYSEVALTRNGDVQFTANGDDYSQNSINPLIQCLVRSGQQNVNVTFKPMIRLASIVDNTFEPYAQTNRQLTINKMAWNDSTEYGVKNLIPYPWYSVNGRENRGITFTFNEEGYITLNGTASTTQQPFFSYTLRSAAGIKNGKTVKVKSRKRYTLSIDKTDDRLWGIVYIGDPTGTSASVATRAVFEDGTTRDATSDYVSLSYNSVLHTSVTFEILTEGDYYLQVDLRMNPNSGSYTNAKGRVILQDAQISDTSWMPYAATNYTLTTKKADYSQIADVELTDNASRAYAKNELMIWYGNLYRVTQAITSGGSITLNTNVVATTLSEEIKAIRDALNI